MADATRVLKLEVATPTGLALQCDAQFVQAPSVHGELGVYPDHLPLLASIKAGVLTYAVEGKTHQAAVGPGFIEVRPDKVLVLTDTFAAPEHIAQDAVHQALQAAEERLRAFPEAYTGPDYNEIQRDIDWAQAQLNAAASQLN